MTMSETRQTRLARPAMTPVMEIDATRCYRALETRDRLLFWHAYLGEERHAAAGRSLRRCVLFKWRRYRRHNERLRLRLPTAAG